MKISRKELIQAIRFLLPAIGTNESRKSLMYLYVEKLENHCVLTAANAYIIKRVKLNIAIDNDAPKPKNEKPFLIPRNILVFYRQMIIKAKHQDFIDISRSELSTWEHGLKYYQPKIEYPNLENLVTGQYLEWKPDKDEIGLNTQFLSEAAASFPDDDRHKGSMVKITFSGNGAIKLHNQTETYISVIMRVKVKW